MAVKSQTYNFTEEDIRRERETNGLSWAKVAQVLGLGSPGAARAAWATLTGTPHTEAKGHTRAPRDPSAPRPARGARQRRSKPKVADRDPKWHEDSSQDEIISALEGATIRVVRQTGFGADEEVRVGRVKEFEFVGKKELLVVHLSDAYNGGHRSFYVRDIVEVKK